MIVFFLIMLLGYYMARKDIFDDKTCKNISWMVINICSPALIITGAFGQEAMEKKTLLLVLGLAICIYLVLILLGLGMPVLLRDKTNKMYCLMTIFGNIGFIGYPILYAMYGSEPLLYVTIFNILYNLLMYTYGIVMISGERFTRSDLKKMCNAGIIACLLEIILYLGQISLPDFLEQTLDTLSVMTGPLSMMVIGASFAALSLKELFADVRLWVFSLLRMFVIPLALMLVVKRFITDEVLLGTCLVMLGVPVGSMTVMLAQQYNGNVQMTSKGIAMTTAMSVVTLPLLSMILL